MTEEEEIADREERAEELHEQLAEELREEEAQAHAAMRKAGLPDAAGLRAAKPPTFDNAEELAVYIQGLVDRPHDYNSVVFALSLAAEAAFEYFAKAQRMTGYQVGCAANDVLRRLKRVEFGRIVDYKELLYPRYATADVFPGVDDLLADVEVVSQLAVYAEELLAREADRASPEVLAWWRELIDRADRLKAAQAEAQADSARAGQG